MLANHPAACSQMVATSGSTGAMPRLGLQATLEGRGHFPGCMASLNDTSGGCLLSGSLQLETRITKSVTLDLLCLNGPFKHIAMRQH